MPKSTPPPAYGSPEWKAMRAQMVGTPEWKAANGYDQNPNVSPKPGQQGAFIPSGPLIFTPAGMTLTTPQKQAQNPLYNPLYDPHSQEYKDNLVRVSNPNQKPVSNPSPLIQPPSYSPPSIKPPEINTQPLQNAYANNNSIVPNTSPTPTQSDAPQIQMPSMFQQNYNTGTPSTTPPSGIQMPNFNKPLQGSGSGTNWNDLLTLAHKRYQRKPMPQTIVIPTQAQLAQWHNSPTSLLSMYQAAHNTPQAVLNPGAALSGGSGPAPGSNPNSVNLLNPVAQQPAPWTLPGYDPSVFKITAPDMPAWQNVSAPAIPQNNMDWVKATTDMINQINQQAQQSANAGRIPGGAGLEGQSSANIHNALAGQLPADVINQIGQQAAERGVSSGSPWGANSNADYLKAIGLNSLQLQNTGQDWLSAATSRNPAAPIFDPSKLLITPAQQAQFALEGANINLANQRGSFDASNANAARQLQASLANASNQQERDRLTLQYQQDQTARENANAQRQLQYDLSNTQNQWERDKLLATFQQEELNRQNALRIAGLRNNNSGYGGYPHSGGGGGNGFDPATNWYSGSPVSTTSMNSNTPWNLPPGQTRANGYNPMPDSYLDQFYNQGTNPPVTTPTYDTTPSDWNNLLPSMSPDYGGPGGLSDEDYFNLYGG